MSSIDVNPRSAAPGALVTVSGTNLRATAQYQLAWDGVQECP